MSPPGYVSQLSLQAPSLNPQVVNVNASTCQNLSLFKDLLKEYRQLDDTINMRLNRTNAQFRDAEREGKSQQQRQQGTVVDEACAYFWRELVENWKRRTAIVDYCVNVVDTSIASKRTTIEESADPAAQRKSKAEMYADQVKRNQVHGELTVERILRQRSLDAFRSRCKFFEPPLTDADARKWWDAAVVAKDAL